MAVDTTSSILTQYAGVLSLGGTATQDVVFVGVVTNGHGVYFEFPIPQKTYSAALAKQYAQGYTGTVESAFQVDGVVGLQWVQIPSNGQLLSAFVVTYESTSGNSTNNVTTPFDKLLPVTLGPVVAKGIAELDDAES
jgi:hypothetical protein